MVHIQLNCDLGEGTGNDAVIMPHISACSIACGGHYGTLDTIIAALQLAGKYHVKTGAHPSYDDPANFGRVAQEWTASQFKESITRQLALFNQALDATGASCAHIKFHGALYHKTAYDASYIEWTTRLLQELPVAIPVFAPYKSPLIDACHATGIPVIIEAFADRRYHPDGRLVSRKQPGALITDREVLINQLTQMALEQKVTTITGEPIDLTAQTYCIHGDNTTIAHHLPAIHKVLQLKNITSD